MVFSDLFFIFAFIPSFALLYILASLIDKKMKTSPDTPYNRTKNWVLVLFSLLFYAWGEPVYVFLMLFSVLVNFRRPRYRPLRPTPQDGTCHRTHLQHPDTGSVQVFGLLRLNPRRPWHQRGIAHIGIAHRNQFLHIPVDIISHRCLSPRVTRTEAIRRLAALHLDVPAAHRRSNCAL